MQRTIAAPQKIHPPLLELIHPREQSRSLLGMLGLGVALGFVTVLWWGLPLWIATLIALALLMVPAVLKWRADRLRYGTTAMVLCILVGAQGFHTVEHMAQWIQYHLLRWPFFKASGLVSAANAEWIHFLWNWAVLLVIVYLIRNGMRNPWAWILLVWTTAHTFEHTYLMLRYLSVLGDMRAMGVTDVAAQGLPGILGRDGWLASSPLTQNTFLCRLPGFTTAVRLDVHFWWNIGETVLLLLAGNAYMARQAKASAEQ